MDKRVIDGARGLVCLTMLAGLAACGGGGSGDSNTDAHSAPPVASVPPSSNNPPATPPAASNPPATVTQPTPDPVEPTQEPTQEEPVQQPGPAANTAPSIAGTPGTQINAGQAYSFTPNATDSDGDTLTFSISSKPSWASFNAATGRLSGTPGAGDVGSHEEIAISVSDGETTRALPQFAINVVQRSNGNVTLAWQAPTENTDGSVLTNLGGYKIHYGTQSGNYSTVITLSNAGLTRYVVENLAPGTYYFAIKAVSGSGTESDLSGEASKTI